MEGELASWLAVPEGHLSIEGSRTAILVLAAVPLAFALLAQISLLRWVLKRRSLRAEAARPPAPGPATVTGVVELEGDGPAVRMEIEQEAGEHYHRQRRRTEQRWREVERRVIPRPFLLRLASGGALRGEPDRHALVATSLVPGTTPLAEKRRLRFLELGAGETLTVRGTIEGEPVAGEGSGYRDAASGKGQELVLRPPRNEPMMIVVGPAGQQAAKRARAHLGGLVLMLLALGLSQLVNVSYHLRRCSGEDTVGTVLRFERRKPSGSKSFTTYLWVAIERKGYSRPVELDFAIGGAKFLASGEPAARLRPGMRVPVRFVPSSPWASELGVGATLWAGRLLPGFLILLLPFIGYGALAARSRREPATLSRLEETEPRDDAEA
jgi:hypothetical protein